MLGLLAGSAAACAALIASALSLVLTGSCFALVAVVTFVPFAYAHQYDLLHTRLRRVQCLGGEPGQHLWWMLFPVVAIALTAGALHDPFFAWIALAVLWVPSMIEIISLYVALGGALPGPGEPTREQRHES